MPPQASTQTLVIAEKPSVAGDIARALGDASKKGDYYESDRYLITSAVGHLVEIYNPNEETAAGGRVKKAGGKWSFESLPALPADFGLRPIKKTAERVAMIAKLAKRKQVDQIINACDAGREGELIFHYLSQYLGFDVKTQRLWLSSMTPAAIRAGLEKLRGSEELKPLRDAAVARSEADWLIGINATRALSALNSKEGGFNLTTAGRVQTPTLALLVERERRRRAHVARTYWRLEAQFEVAAGKYQGYWVKDAKDESDPEDRPERLWDGKRAEELCSLCQQQGSGEATDSVKERRLGPPALFDLNELQREANKLFSLPARRTLGAAQALYERYKLLTYPRTESRHLPADYVSVCEKTLAKLASGSASGPVGGWLDMDTIAGCAVSSRAGVGEASKRVFDDAKVSDHFAIIPTGELPNNKLPELEQRIYDLVCRRFVGVFMPPAKVRETVRTTTIAGESFRTKGRVIVEPGWMTVARSGANERSLPPLAGSTEQAMLVDDVEVSAHETKPPARYDDASLLGAMQRAAAFVESEELSEVLASTGGLGTPATRATIIEELIRTGYIERDGKELLPQAKALSLIELLTDMKISELTKPDLTAVWENRLRGIEEGSDDSDQFIEGIRKLAGRIVEVARGHDPDAVDGDYKEELDAPCPRCGGKLSEGYRKYFCSNDECRLFFWKTIAGRQLAPEEAEILVRDGRIGPFEDFRSKLQRPFTATLILGEDGKIDMEFPDQEAEDVDLEATEQIGSCPKCGAAVHLTPRSFSCRLLLDGSGGCDFRLSRSICQRPISEQEARKLFDPESGRTDLLADFISKRGRPFKAHLKLAPKTGKLEFEFAEAKKPVKKKAAKKKPGKKTTTAARKKAA